MPGTHYAMGFAVSPDGQQVLLLEKTRPAFLAGRTTGVFRSSCTMSFCKLTNLARTDAWPAHGQSGRSPGYAISLRAEHG